MSEVHIAQVVASLAAQHGGPSRSVRALANAQARTGATVELLAIEQPGELVAPQNDAAQVRVFPGSFPRKFGCSTGLRNELEAGRPDCIHHHGLWLRTLDYSHRASVRKNVPLVISPRGMLSDWSYHHHRWRKRWAARFVHPGALTGANGWHATSEAEAGEIRRHGFAQPVCVAPNGVDLPTEEALAAARNAWPGLCPALRGRPVALFYSRFHRKKRLRELVELWGSAPRGDWFLLIVGVPEEYPLAEVQAWISATGARDRMAVFDGTSHPPPYAAASLFLLPSHSENFGLVIAEALAAGLPVLSTDATPWASLNSHGAGWCVPWDDFESALQRALAEPPTSLRDMGRRGRALVAAEFSWDRNARLLLEFYQQLRRG
ncbi:MAG TPA: glycosyltransferase [Candidatus Didemnitutus sp.]|nr:glycosyltransferase [Candidatus Didemnitutus sp.]